MKPLISFTIHSVPIFCYYPCHWSLKFRNLFSFKNIAVKREPESCVRLKIKGVTPPTLWDSSGAVWHTYECQTICSRNTWSTWTPQGSLVSLIYFDLLTIQNACTPFREDNVIKMKTCMWHVQCVWLARCVKLMSSLFTSRNKGLFIIWAYRTDLISDIDLSVCGKGIFYKNRRKLRQCIDWCPCWFGREYLMGKRK